MQTSRTWFAANVVDGRIYLIGGYDGVNILSLVEEFDTGFISVDPGGKLSKTWGTLKAE